jgi:ankyrin repeat protein
MAAKDNIESNRILPCLKGLANQPDAPSWLELSKLSEEGKSTAASNSEKPTLQLLRGIVLNKTGDYVQSVDILIQALNTMNGKDYPIAGFFIPISLIIEGEYKSGRGSEKKYRKYCKLMCKSLVGGIIRGQFPGDDIEIAYRLPSDILGKPIADRQWLDFWEILENRGDIDPWFKAMARGKYWISSAWELRTEARNPDFGKNENEEFGLRLKKAADSFKDASYIRKNWPEPFSELMVVSMAGLESEGGSKKGCLGFATHCQVDYPKVFLQYAWTLRPRWGGSHEKMLKFARDCLDISKRNTDVPLFYFRMLRDIAEELPPATWRSLYRREDVRGDLEKIFGMISAPDTFTTDSFTTAIGSLREKKIEVLRGIVKMWQGDYEAAAKILRPRRNTVDLSDGFWRRPLTWQERSWDSLMAELDLALGKGGDDFQKALDLSRVGNSESKSRAVELFMKLEERFRDDPEALKVIADNCATLFLKSNWDAFRDLRSLFNVAVFEGSQRAVSYLLERNHHLDITAAGGLDGLLIACQKGNVELVAYLLDHGFKGTSRNEKGSTAVHEACRHKDHRLLQYLLEHGLSPSTPNDFGSTPLHMAAQYSTVETVRLLIEAGCPVNALTSDNWSALTTALRYSHDDIACELISRGADVHVVTSEDNGLAGLAASFCKPETLKMLLKAGVEINSCDKYGRTALILACNYGREAQAEILLDAGADPHVKNSEGWGVIHFATLRSLHNIVRRLVKAGADINLYHSGHWAPIHYAVRYSDLKMVQLMVELGAKLESPTGDGTIPLHLAISMKKGDMAECLIKGGADLLARNQQGITAYDRLKSTPLVNPNLLNPSRRHD